MDSKYFRELEIYPKSFLIEEIGEKIFDQLLEEGFLVKSMIKSKNCNENCFKFKYVGLIILNEIIINCYPKYIVNKKNVERNFKETVKVIKHYFDKKYKKDYNTFDYGISNLDEIPFNLLSVMLFFIEDYYENGVYTKFHDILESNGNGEINWNKTIDENFPVIIDKKPYYIELQTKSKFNNFFSYFRLLHEYIITDCSNYLKNTGLLDMLGLTSVELSENNLDNFGQKNFILNKISQELNIEFNTRKRKLLHLMYAYIKHKNSLLDENSLIIYGTSYYHVIWEDICKVIFDDKLYYPLSELFPELEKNNDKTLISIIEKPKWILDRKSYDTDKTLIPDIITINEKNNGEKDFIIFDAKYYQYELYGNKIHHQPGIESVTKQYLYQIAFNDFIKEHNLDKVKNAFLLPFDGKDVLNKGKVEFKILSNLCSEDIQVILLPTSEVNQLYLDNEKMDICRLNLYCKDNSKK